MEGKYSEEEIYFIKEVLQQHGDFLNDLLADDIKKKRLISKDNKDVKLIDQFKNAKPFHVDASKINPKLVFEFFGYGRAIEIDYFKSKNVKSFSSSRDIWGVKKKKKRKKDTRWYTYNVMGSLNRLVGVLGSEYSEHERKRIKEILNNQKSRIAL